MIRALILVLSVFLLQTYSYGQCDGSPYNVQCDPGDGSSCSARINTVDDVLYGRYSIGYFATCCGAEAYSVTGQYSICYSAELSTPEATKNLLALMQDGDVFLPDCRGELGRYLSKGKLETPTRKRPQSFEIPIRFSFERSSL